MSAFDRIKFQVRQQRANPYTAFDPIYMRGDQDEITILPQKPKKKRKMMEVQRESKVTLNHIQNNEKGKKGGKEPPPPKELDDEEMGSDEDREEDEKIKEPKRVPWGPSDILDHLDKPQTVENVNYVIKKLKEKGEEEEGGEDDDMGGESEGKKKKKKHPTVIVWDHSQSKEGKKSDNNFFIWFETMTAGETRKIIERENMIFE